MNIWIYFAVYDFISTIDNKSCFQRYIIWKHITSHTSAIPLCTIQSTGLLTAAILWFQKLKSFAKEEIGARWPIEEDWQLIKKAHCENYDDFQDDEDDNDDEDDKNDNDDEDDADDADDEDDEDVENDDEEDKDDNKDDNQDDEDDEVDESYEDDEDDETYESYEDDEYDEYDEYDPYGQMINNIRAFKNNVFSRLFG